MGEPCPPPRLDYTTGKAKSKVGEVCVNDSRETNGSRGTVTPSVKN
nr:MAG TPA: hypothetical protein [Caudoviricetes sp.]